MLNGIWVVMIVAAIVCGAATGALGDVTTDSVVYAGKAVEIAIGLVGMMALWLGLMRVLQEAGVLRSLARALQPIMSRLFPGVPVDHPAMSMMILNIVANMLGLANAATPFGIKAMIELDKLNDRPGVATNAMALFLAINTSALALLPTGVIGLRAGLGADAPGSIILTSFAATSCSTLTAIVVCLSLQRLRIFALPPKEEVVEVGPKSGAGDDLDTSDAEELMRRQVTGIRKLPIVVAWAGMITLVVTGVGTAFYSDLVVDGWSSTWQAAAGKWLLVLLMVGIVLFGVYKKVRVYDAVVTGGKEGFAVALRIIPYLVAILAAVGMLRASGAIDLMALALDPITSTVGMPAETLPMALLRPLTGSGAYGVAAGIMVDHGADSLIGNIVSTMQGSTETTFYVLALYFGVVGVRRARHTVAACLTADVVGALAAVWAVRIILF